MLHDVIAASYQGQYKIALEFDDGSRGVVDLSSYLQRGGVFERFKDIEFFRSFRVGHPIRVGRGTTQAAISPNVAYPCHGA
jgi:hypothetical protein